MKSRILAADTPNHLGQSIRLEGWVHNLRQMGNITFIDLRDRTGLVQLVCDQSLKLAKLGHEYVISVSGEVRQRDPRFHNPKLATGNVEVGVSNLEVLSVSADLPFEVRHDTAGIKEEVRLRYRYLDIRAQRMQHNLRLRHRVVQYLQAYLDKLDFIQVETPLLTKGTPEGSREYLVPARLQPGEFYVLPQSPQQFKQLLMVGGIERYYQIARALRDEDPRGDRQPEFTQVDIEMSFTDQEEMRSINEAMMCQMIADIFPDKQITTTPFPVLTYQEAIDRYGSDKPDLRKDTNNPNELAFCWIVDFPMFEINSESSKTDAVHHPFTAPKPEDAHLLEDSPHQAKADAYDLVLNGSEIAGGSIRIHNADLQAKVFELLGLSKQDAADRFGHLLQAFKYGVPPHGGIAYGLDRLVMLLTGEPNIREVIAFPKTGDGRDLMMGAPSAVPEDRLADVHIKSVQKQKHKTA